MLKERKCLAVVANLAVKQMTLASAIFAQAIISDLKLEKITICPFFIVVKELKLIQRTLYVIFVKQSIPAFQVSIVIRKKKKHTNRNEGEKRKTLNENQPKSKKNKQNHENNQ